MNKWILILYFIAAPVLSHAGGFQINTQGQKTSMMGGSVTGLALDGSVAFYNPAGMSFLDSNYVNAGLSLIFPASTYLGSYNGSEKMASQIYTPFYTYITLKLKKKISAGISINTPFGLGTKWDDNWSGRYIAQETKIRTVFIQPTISYQLSDHFSIGAGPAFVMGSANLRKALPYTNEDNSEASAEFKGKANAIGFNAGIFWKGEKFSIGIDYRSQVKLDIKDGDATFTNVPSSLMDNNTIPASTTFKTTINLPSVTSLGIGYKANEKMLINLDLNYTGWSVYKSLNFEFSDYPSLNTDYQKNYKSVLAIRGGVEYKATNKTVFRAGLAYDQSPVKKGYVSPELPDANKFIVSGGFTYRVKHHLYLEGSLIYEDVTERKENANLNDGFNGTYKSYIYIIGLGLQYNF